MGSRKGWIALGSSLMLGALAMWVSESVLRLRSGSLTIAVAVFLVAVLAWMAADPHQKEQPSAGVDEFQESADRTVLVVDMMGKFAAARNQDTIAAVTAELRRAMLNGQAILFVEYENHGRTLPQLLQAVDGYKRKGVVTKNGADGSAAILALARQRGFPLNLFRVTGVNVNACVSATVHGLLQADPACRIEVVRDACNDKYVPNWQHFEHPRIKLI